ncbi:uncharacterized protein LOC131938228 [Physella acuta]|uniref:uncharacterized protein LOC131938228 n=1 Tax=Physella acuta TaxID=109671 RepID=UPI0027DCE0F7|nr:uncharacterized protein LOC131938228 [Physella acuta]
MRAIILLLLSIYGCKASNCPETAAADACVAQFWSEFHQFDDFTYINDNATLLWSSVCEKAACVVQVLDNCPRGPVWEPYLIIANILEYFCSMERFINGLQFLQCAGSGQEAEVKSDFSTCFTLTGPPPCLLSFMIKDCLIGTADDACTTGDVNQYVEYAEGIMERYDRYYCAPPTTDAATTTNAVDTSVVDTTTTAPDGTTTTTAPTTPSTRLCYKCQSGLGTARCHACPADGDTTGWNRTKVVSCNGPCVKTTTQTAQGTHVVRGCSDGKFPSTVIQPSGCVTYLGKDVCFCSGDRCN